jgi:hypothetical protein
MKKSIKIDLEYPRLDENPDTIEIGLSDVRMVDNIRIKYDFDRDGWQILQGGGVIHIGWVEDNDIWLETAFVPSWQFYDKDER